MSQERGLRRVDLTERVQLDNDGMVRVYFKGVVFIELLHLSGVGLLHHGHDHAHGGTYLTEEDRGLIAKAL